MPIFSPPLKPPSPQMRSAGSAGSGPRTLSPTTSSSASTPTTPWTSRRVGLDFLKNKRTFLLSEAIPSGGNAVPYAYAISAWAVRTPGFERGLLGSRSVLITGPVSVQGQISFIFCRAPVGVRVWGEPLEHTSQRARLLRTQSGGLMSFPKLLTINYDRGRAGRIIF